MNGRRQSRRVTLTHDESFTVGSFAPLHDERRPRNTASRYPLETDPFMSIVRDIYGKDFDSSADDLDESTRSNDSRVSTENHPLHDVIMGLHLEDRVTEPSQEETTVDAEETADVLHRLPDI